MIDLSRARKIFADAQELLEDLDGFDIEDFDDISDRPLSGERPSRDAIAKIRTDRAQAGRDLMLLGDRLAACEAVVRDAYWAFRGEDSIFTPERAS